MIIEDKVFVTRQLPGDAVKKLSQKYEVEVWDKKGPISREELIRKLKGKNAVITLLRDIIDREVIDNAPHLRIIANYAVGYDNIDVEYASLKNIYVTNTPRVLTDATAELGWALLLSVARRLREADIFLREGKFSGWEPDLFLGKQVTGSKIGVIGVGRIGKSFMKKGSGYDIEWCYYSRNRDKDIEKEFNAVFKEPLGMFEECDFVSLHVPLTKETYHMIGKEHFDRANGVVLINTSRGAVVDENEMIRALKNGKLLGVGLDVYEREPFVAKELIQLENVILLPHIGSATHTTREKMAEMACLNVDNALSGKVPPNLVNRGIMNKK